MNRVYIKLSKSVCIVYDEEFIFISTFLHLYTDILKCVNNTLTPTQIYNFFVSWL